MNLDRTFSALGEPTRRAIVAQLAQGEMALSKVAEPFDMSQTAVTRHVNVLSEAGLVSVTKRGRTRYCRLHTEPMKVAWEWLTDYQQFWDQNLQNLADYLNEDG